MRPIKGGGRAVGLLKRSTSLHDIRTTWEQLRYPVDLNAAIRDLWRHEDLPSAPGSFTAMVPGHGVVMITMKY